MYHTIYYKQQEGARAGWGATVKTTTAWGPTSYVVWAKTHHITVPGTTKNTLTCDIKAVPVLSVLSKERSMRKWKTVPYGQSTNVRLRSKQICYKDMKSNNHQRPTAYGPRLWHYCLIIAFKIDDELQLRKSYKERGQNEGALYPQATIVRWSRHSAISYSSITYVSRIGPTIVLGWTTTKDDMFTAFLRHIFKTIQPDSTPYIMYGMLISTQEW